MPDHATHAFAARPRGPSSYWLQDPKAVFAALGLAPGHAFLDAGCGPGDYALEAARLVGPEGRVHAFDIAEQYIKGLAATAAGRGIAHLHAGVADLTAGIPLPDAAADVCLAATVLHVPQVARAMEKVLGEIRRVLKPGGLLAVIECAPRHWGFGPPASMRLSAQQVEAVAAGCGFGPGFFLDLKYNYLITFKKI